MRTAKRNSLILLAASIGMSLTIAVRAWNITSSASEALTPLESRIGGLDWAIGNAYGKLYSINGQELASLQNGRLYAIDGFTSIIGSAAGGMIKSLEPILLANHSKVNRTMREGDSVQTTLYPPAQLESVRQLADYSEETEACITVVLADGAVIVSAGNNSCSQSAFFSEQPPKDLLVDYSAAAKKKGSCFKPAVYRAILQNIDKLPPELDFTSGSFEDISFCNSAGGNVIHNWDWIHAENYGLLVNSTGLRSRSCTLSDLLKYSSNTAPVRICAALGNQNAYCELTRIFALDSPLITEISEISGISSPSVERISYLFFGQDACLSPVRMCTLYNHLITGKFFTPFYVTAVTFPDGQPVYTAYPSEKTKYHMEIDISEDMLNNALTDTFESYLNGSLRAKYPDMVNSRRLLAKSGTAEINASRENRTIMLSLLSPDRTQLICTACITVNNAPVNRIGNAELIEKLMAVLNTMGVF